MSYIDEYRKTAKEQFGLPYLRPYQELIIRHILENDEHGTRTMLLGCLPTGSGKSICFMLPPLLMKKKTIIIYPLLSLMKDQEKRFSSRGIDTIVLQGGIKRDELYNAIKAFKGDVNIMITNPEMLLSLIDRKLLESIKKDVSMIVIDEAHTAVTWGESFRESFLHLPEIIDYFQPQHLCAYTATMDRHIEEGILKLIFPSSFPYIVHASADRENIFYTSVKSYSKLSDSVKILSDPANRPAIIFCRSRSLAENIALSLSSFFDSKHYHAGLDKEEREKIERWFMESRSGVLAATTAYGMGVDKPDIRTIIHLSIPDSASAFLQESGRGGRDGNRFKSFVLYHPDEEGNLSYIFKGKECIRTQLLMAMNERPEEKACLSCSNCEGQDYIPAGLSEIMKAFRRRLILNKKNVDRILSSKKIWKKRYMALWDEKDSMRALSDLKQKRYIRKIGNETYMITIKGCRYARMLTHAIISPRSHT